MWIQIGDQVWLAENLRYKTDEGSWCWNNDETGLATNDRIFRQQNRKDYEQEGASIYGPVRKKRVTITGLVISTESFYVYLIDLMAG